MMPRVKAEAITGGRPLISVVMPVHNALPYLDESIGSILNQTFKDFEFVILDDASTDGSGAHLREWAGRDKRIRLYETPRQLGPSGSSNFVVGKASAEVIARMDADDVSHAERLGRQWEIIKSRPEVALVGTLFEGIDERGHRVRPRDRWRLTRRSAFSPFPHGSAMFRRQVFYEVGGYREACAGWEDQDLFLRIRLRGPIVILSDALYYYRFQVNSVVSGRSMERAAKVIGQQQRCLQELRSGRDYTWLLNETEPNGHHRTALADAFYLRGSMRLWAGQSPQILSLMLQHKSLGFGLRPLRALLLAIWSAANPASLRFCLRSFIRARDLLASRRVKDGGIYEWRLE
jgi:glycosyltransferase involved in cell wall biosynthesis